MQESCPLVQAAESARLEMQRYPFTSYRSREDFDPHHHIGVVNGRKYEHRVDLEDYWTNAADEFEVKKRLWSKLPVSFIRTTELFRVPGQLEDDGEYIQPGFDERLPLPPTRWSEPKLVDLTTFMRPVIKYSQWWLDQRIQQLQRNGMALTYNLMGKAESYSSNASVSQGNEPAQEK